MKSLFIPLKKMHFESFIDGSKRTEYRLYGPRWNERTIFPGRAVTLSLGYSGKRMTAKVLRLRKVKNTITDLYPRGATLAAIDLTDITETCRYPQ